MCFLAHREGVHRPIRVNAQNAGEFRWVRQRILNRILDDLEVVGEVPLVGGPDQVGETIVHDYAAKTRHEHSEQSTIRLERGRVGLGADGFCVQQCCHPWVVD